MALEGNALSETEVRTVIKLLASMDMTLGDIAVHMRCTRQAVASINRRHQIRYFSKRLGSWKARSPDFVT
jgi:hypothetical protein